MAGFYADPPGLRFNLSLDGTRAFLLNSGKTVTTETPAILPPLDDTDSDSYTIDSGTYMTGGATRGFVAFIFPEKRDLTHWWLGMTNGYAGLFAVETSVNSTDGLDGTWTTYQATTPSGLTRDSITPSFRTSFHTLSPAIAGVTGVRFPYGSTANNGNNNYVLAFQAFHVYGNYSTGENPDRLRFWHQTADQEVTGGHFDFGDIIQGGQGTKQFRVKNNSATKTANGVTVTKDSPSFNTEMASGLKLSLDQSTWADQVSLGALAPGALSSVIHIRRTVGLSETPSIPKMGRLTADATSWT